MAVIIDHVFGMCSCWDSTIMIHHHMHRNGKVVPLQFICTCRGKTDWTVRKIHACAQTYITVLLCIIIMYQFRSQGCTQHMHAVHRTGIDYIWYHVCWATTALKSCYPHGHTCLLRWCDSQVLFSLTYALYLCSCSHGKRQTLCTELMRVFASCSIWAARSVFLALDMVPIVFTTGRNKTMVSCKLSLSSYSTTQVSFILAFALYLRCYFDAIALASLIEFASAV